MKTSTLKGTNDYLPSQVLLRDYLQSVILETYRRHGFERIMTPVIEDIENLDKSDGGENLNLIFKILKRGEKLNKAVESGNSKELADMGLRYDLTLPLTRYYANNRANLGYPMKCIQIDRVYRAEQPQKGRMREFFQCDIDIIGSSSNTCEIELIDTTAEALMKIGINNFVIKINDRRLLKNILLNIGFLEEELDSVCITIDKFDKIGAEGVRAELFEKNFSVVCIDKMIAIFGNLPMTLNTARTLCSDTSAVENLETIINAVSQMNGGRYVVEFDISLVRGQGYYTGTIFEIQSPDFKGSIGGGGRYDNLIGKFLDEDIPAVGFSIGFERIFSILSEAGFIAPGKKRIAILFNAEEFTAANRLAESFRLEYDVVMYEKPKKLSKFIKRLEEQNVIGFINFSSSNDTNELKFFDN